MHRGKKGRKSALEAQKIEQVREYMASQNAAYGASWIYICGDTTRSFRLFSVTTNV